MIFAAGLGTRLRPLTDHCPKALVKVGDKPMLQHTIEHLKAHGFDEIIINIHYLGNQIKEFLQEHHHFGIRIEISDETEQVLETGGGLWKAKDFFDDHQSFLVCNADVFTNINLTEFYHFNKNNEAIASLAVRNRASSRYLLFDDENILFGWENVKKNEVKIPRKIRRDAAVEEKIQANNGTYPLHEFAFSGYQILSPEIFATCKRDGVFSMVDWYLDICNEHTIKAYHHDEDNWIDIGSPEQLEKANALISSAH